MKSKILLLALFFVFFVKNTVACPIWLVGKMYVVNEKNERLNATVWKVTNSDSFMMDKGKTHGWYDTIEANKDSTVFEFWEGGMYGWYSNDRPKITRSYYRIKAVGFADLIIKDIDFEGKSRTDYPVLYVKMYPRTYHKVGEVTTLIEQYAYDVNVVVSDSFELNLSHYVQSLEENNTKINNGNKSILAVESYPNPITDYIILKINSNITQPYVLKLLDMKGNVVNEAYLTLQETKYELQSQAKGSYFVQVFDPKGNPIYSRKFIKL